ncbi:cytochrome b5-like heme/steroid binding domain-containing protein [Baffinella frigidus]|nr:cytochrome b5-like heme/steroid binding domain-containing protein [Cryptophyta sp. CCMP2293]
MLARSAMLALQRAPLFRPAARALSTGSAMKGAACVVGTGGAVGVAALMWPKEKVTMEEVMKHSSPEDAWIVIDGKVYNISKYISASSHPGSAPVLKHFAGKDATEAFAEHHKGSKGKLIQHVMARPYYFADIVPS